MRGIFDDLSEKRFGNLVVVSIAPKHLWKSPSSYWICNCDCGKQTVVRGTHLTGDDVNSCGCLSKKINRNHPHWKGYEDISSRVFNRIKHCAKKRKISFNVTIQQIWDLFLKQNKTCALTGLSLTFPSRDKGFDGTASLDRIDSAKGYVDGNIQWVHKDANRLKGVFTEQRLFELCDLVVKQRQQRQQRQQ